jgi:hypothetical protein
MLLWTICPIAVFCSQKLWIDNALVCFNLLSITLFLCIINETLCIRLDGGEDEDGIEDFICTSRLKTFFNFFSFQRHWCTSFLIGLIIFGISINTKMTSVALIPFFVLYYVMNNIWNYRLIMYELVFENEIKVKDSDEKTSTTTTSTTSAAPSVPQQQGEKSMFPYIWHMSLVSISSIFLFGVGCVASYAPWTYYYWVSAMLWH